MPQRPASNPEAGVSRKGRFLKAAAAVLGLAVLWGCGGEAVRPTGPRLVLLYSPCSVSKFELAPYAPEVPFTPHLREFAETATTFEDHYTESPLSGIAYASIFSGAQADRHGVFRHPAELPEDLFLIFEAFAANGYEAFFWNRHTMATPELGYAQGVPPENRHEGLLHARDPRFLAILDRLESEPGYGAFVVTNFTVSHTPYPGETIARFRERYPALAGDYSLAEVERFSALHQENHLPLSKNFDAAVETLDLAPSERQRFFDFVDLMYRANVSHLDDLFGQIVETVHARGLADETMIAFVADHGEVLLREGVVFPWEHSMQLAPEAISPPFLLSWPGGAPGPRRFSGPTRSIDVYPTLAGLAGIELPADAGIQGVDLSPALRGEQAPPSLSAFVHTGVLVNSVHLQMLDPEQQGTWGRVQRLFPDADPRWMWAALKRDGTLYKLRRLGDEGFVESAYDAASDPRAMRDRLDPDDPDQQRALADLHGYKQHLVSAYEATLADERLLPPEAEAERLRSLGYIH